MAACEDWIPSVETLLTKERLGRQEWNHLKQDLLDDDQYGFFRDYRPFDDMVAYVRHLVEKHSDIARFTPSIGETHEGRAIPVVHISADIHAVQRPSKKTIWFNGGIHAREFISSHTAVFVLQRLLEEYASGNNTQVKRYLEEMEFVMAPHINPDGYEYARLQDRMVR